MSHINDFPWSAFKEFVDERSLSIQWLDDGENYHLSAVDNIFQVCCLLSKSNPNDDLIDFETNYKPLGNRSPLTKSYPFSMADGFRHRAKGFAGTANFGTATNLQWPVTEERYMNGLALILNNHVFGDTCDFEVVDVDYLYAGTLYPADYGGTPWSVAAPTGVMLDRFGEAWGMNPSSAIQGPYLVPYYAKLYAGLYIRIKYHSVGSVDVGVIANMFLHKKT